MRDSSLSKIPAAAANLERAHVFLPTGGGRGFRSQPVHHYSFLRSSSISYLTNVRKAFTPEENNLVTQAAFEGDRIYYVVS